MTSFHPALQFTDDGWGPGEKGARGQLSRDTGIGQLSKAKKNREMWKGTGQKQEQNRASNSNSDGLRIRP